MNLLLDTDSYKLSHPLLYPADMTGMSAYIEARTEGEIVPLFGLQAFIKKYLMRPITIQNLNEAEDFAKEHGEPFARDRWAHVVHNCGGYLPVKIYAAPEGLRIPSQNVLVRVDCEDLVVPWMPMAIETSLQRGVWYPSTIVANDYKNWRLLRRYWLETSDNSEGVQFALHDFGARGSTSKESASIGGGSHCVYFSGSDTITGVKHLRDYYHAEMAAFSVPATEHSIQCAWGPMEQKEYLERVLSTYAKPGAIVSVVLDGYELIREVKLLCELKEKFNGAKVVFRLDSGDALVNIPIVIALMGHYLGWKMNSKGFKVLNGAGILQGDGVDYKSTREILEAVTSLGWSAENIVFGSGGALLQKINRDTYGFAQKASAVKRAGKWIGIKKEAPGKPSKSGLQSLYQSRLTGEFTTSASEVDSEWKPVLELVYDHGKLLRDETLDVIRERAKR